METAGWIFFINENKRTEQPVARLAASGNTEEMKLIYYDLRIFSIITVAP